MPEVSVILPSYNGARYIREAIDSVREQTYSDWELIIVDDCSDDDTLKIGKEYEKRDNRIRVVHNNVNMKLPKSLNIGFEHAKGKYLTWTSDDNIYLPNALEIMVKKIELSNAAMVCASAYVIDEEGKINQDIILEYIEEELCRRNTVGACFLYKREVLYTVGEYDTELFCVEDYDYWIRIKKQYGKIEKIDEILYKYRFHEASLTFLKRERIRLSIIELRKKHLEFILSEYKEKKELLCALYYDLLETKRMDQQICEAIQTVIPELKNDTPGEKEKYIIFGAGKYGDKALIKLKDKVNYFADNDAKKVGKYKNGKEIISFKRMVEISDRYNILIAVHNDIIYQLVYQLFENGINQYCTLQTYLSGKI